MMHKRTHLRQWRPLILLLACSAALLVTASVSAQEAQPEPAQIKDLSAPLQSIMEARRLPGLAGVAMRNGQVAARGAAGVRRAGLDEAVSADDLWHIGSCTKAMTATLAARLVDAGTIRWDATIGECLGDVDGLGEKILDPYRDVTLKQLLAHRSGLPEDRAPDWSIWVQVRALTGPIIEQRRAAVALVLSREPASTPGSKMAYSNFGYVVAAAMMEQVTGKSWEELILAEVFEPLHMTTAGFGPPSADSNQRESASQPWGHQTVSGESKPVEPWAPAADNPAVIFPAGGVHVSLADWAKFAAMHVKGARGEDTTYLCADSWKTLHADPWNQGYALGWAVGQRPWARGRVLTHTGSNGAWMAVVWLAPNCDAAVVAATNLGNDSASAGCDDAVVAALRAIELLPVEP